MPSEHEIFDARRKQAALAEHHRPNAEMEALIALRDSDPQEFERFVERNAAALLRLAHYQDGKAAAAAEGQ